MGTNVETVAGNSGDEQDAMSLEARMAGVVRAMREAAAAGRDDDYFAERAKQLLDRRPVVFIAVATPGETHAWAIEPGQPAALRANVPSAFAEYASADVVDVGMSFLLHEIETRVSWLMQERSGVPLSEPVLVTG